MKDKILIRKRELQGEDGYKTFSIRIKDEVVDKLNKLAADANRSRNEVVSILLEYAIDNCEIIEKCEINV
ncbi:MAG: ribbon-helix-helix protein, CopG family [Clostridia bacterium]|nr:ribbon-helix-helix protein, CopG family [Clostridia bacterium]